MMEGVEEGTVWDGGGHRYQLEKVVGNGAFGVVWRARAEDGDVVAIKKVMLDRRYHNRELQMMKVMDHENVVRLRHYFEKAGRKKDETFLHLVMDFLPETIRSVALKHHKRAQRFSPDHIKAYLWQTFRALEYIHARRICHRDIKPDNLLCDPVTLKCRLCDFGCSKVLVKGQPNVSYICSRYYRAPELMFGATEYAVGVDVWSVGTILMELLLGHLPYQGQDSTQQHLVEIMKLLGTPSDRDLQAMRANCCAADLPKLKPFPWERIITPNTPPDASDLAQRLLRYDPDQRLSAPQALAHPFFDGAQELIDRPSNATGAPVSASRTSSNPAQRLEQWESKAARSFDEVIAEHGAALKKADASILQRLEAQLAEKPLSKDGVGQIVDILKQELTGSSKQLDERVRDLQKSMVAEAKQLRLQLPVERAGGSSAANAAQGQPSSEEAARLKQEVAGMRAAKLALENTLVEKERLVAQIKAAREQNAAAGGADGGGGGSAGRLNEAGVQTEEEGGRPTTPGYGRRAPQPSRVQSTLSEGDVSPSSWQNSERKAPPMLTDNFGQVRQS